MPNEPVGFAWNVFRRQPVRNHRWAGRCGYRVLYRGCRWGSHSSGGFFPRAHGPVCAHPLLVVSAGGRAYRRVFCAAGYGFDDFDDGCRRRRWVGDFADAPVGPEETSLGDRRDELFPADQQFSLMGAFFLMSVVGLIVAIVASVLRSLGPITDGFN